MREQIDGRKSDFEINVEFKRGKRPQIEFFLKQYGLGGLYKNGLEIRAKEFPAEYKLMRKRLVREIGKAAFERRLRA